MKFINYLFFAIFMAFLIYRHNNAPPVIIIFIIVLLFVSFITTVASQNVIRVSKRGAPLKQSPIISAVLLECPKEEKHSRNSDESSSENCEQQLMVNIRVSPSFRVEKIEKFLILDEVYDQRRRTRAKIMSPYVIEISRGEPVVMYPLQFTKSIKCDSCAGQKNNGSTCSRQASSMAAAEIPSTASAEDNLSLELQKTRELLGPNSLAGNDKNSDETTPTKQKISNENPSDMCSARSGYDIDEMRHRRLNDNPEAPMTTATSGEGSPINLKSLRHGLGESGEKQQPAIAESGMSFYDDADDHDDNDDDEDDDDDDDDDEDDDDDGDRSDQSNIDGYEDNNEYKNKNGQHHRSTKIKTNKERTQFGGDGGGLKNQQHIYHPMWTENDRDINGKLLRNIAEHSNMLQSDILNGFRANQRPAAAVGEIDGDSHELTENIQSLFGAVSPHAAETTDAFDAEGADDEDGVSDDGADFAAHQFREPFRRDLQQSKNQQRHDSPPPIHLTNGRLSNNLAASKLYYPTTGQRQLELHNSQRRMQSDRFDLENEISADAGDLNLVNHMPIRRQRMQRKSCQDDICGNQAKQKQQQNEHPNHQPHQQCRTQTCTTATVARSNADEFRKQQNHVNAIDVRDQRVDQRNSHPQMKSKTNAHHSTQGDHRDDSALHFHESASNLQTNPINFDSAKYFSKDFPKSVDGNANGNGNNDRTRTVQKSTMSNGAANKFSQLREKLHSQVSGTTNNLWRNNPLRLRQEHNGNAVTDGDEQEHIVDMKQDPQSHNLKLIGVGKAEQLQEPRREATTLPSAVNLAGRSTSDFDAIDDTDINLTDSEPNNVKSSSDDSHIQLNFNLRPNLQNNRNEQRHRISEDWQDKSIVGNVKDNSMKIHKNNRDPTQYSSNFDYMQAKMLKMGRGGPSSTTTTNDDTNHRPETAFDSSYTNTENSERNVNINNNFNTNTNEAQDVQSDRIYDSVGSNVAPSGFDARDDLIHNPFNSREWTIMADKSISESEDNPMSNTDDSVNDGDDFLLLPQQERASDGDAFNSYTGFNGPVPYGKFVNSTSLKELLHNEPSEFLPQKPPLAEILDDPNLSIKDKVQVLEVIDPHSEGRDRKLDEMFQEMHSPYHVPDLTQPFQAPQAGYDSERQTYSSRRRNTGSKGLKKQNQQRDLNSERLLDAELEKIAEEEVPCKECGGKKFSKIPIPMQGFVENEIERSDSETDDLTSCKSCGGGKRVNTKSSKVHVHQPCDCRGQRNCKCSSTHPSEGTTRKIRTVADAWYSVFNMSAPLQFLTTNVRILRKRHDTWLEIAPSITLTSLSGIYANGNLSILFSSHVDIFQLKKSLRLQNHKLLIPKDAKPRAATTNNDKKSPPSSSTMDEIANLLSSNPNPNTILAIDAARFNFDSLLSDVDSDFTNSAGGKLEMAGERMSSSIDGNSYSDAKKNLCRMAADTIRSKSQITKEDDDDEFYPERRQLRRRRRRRQRRRKSLSWRSTNSADGRSESIHSITDFGYFPDTTNFLERCPHDKNHLCLNLLDDQVPAYTIKLKMPFHGNALIYPNDYRVRITSVITDATTKYALQVVVGVVNEGFTAHEFGVYISNCPMPCISGRMKVRKYLAPHIGETVSFLLPLDGDTLGHKGKDVHCDVEVKLLPNATTATTTPNNEGSDQKVISQRRITIKPDGRCLCIWECDCYCVPHLVSYIDYHVCHKLAIDEEQAAGLLSPDDSQTSDWDDDDDDLKHNIFWTIYYSAVILMSAMLVLGLLKAILGVAIRKIDKFGYDYVQPLHKYEYATRCRRFVVNVVIFIVWPFVFWCKCFTPTEDDLLAASTEWQCALVQDRRSTSSSNADDRSGFGKDGRFKNGNNDIHFYRGHDDDDDEETILSQHVDRTSGNAKQRLLGGYDDVHYGATTTVGQSRFADWQKAMYDCDYFMDYDYSDEEKDTKFVIQALTESRRSLSKLLRNHSSEQLDLTDSRAKKSDELIQALKSAQIVYRTFDVPMGNVVYFDVGQRYSVQGYFLPSIGPEYEFVNYEPMMQHRRIAANGKSTEIVHPPIKLHPKEFARVYGNKLEVLEAGDLSIRPPSDAPCINVSEPLPLPSMDFVSPYGRHCLWLGGQRELIASGQHKNQIYNRQACQPLHEQQQSIKVDLSVDADVDTNNVDPAVGHDETKTKLVLTDEPPCIPDGANNENNLNALEGNLEQ